MKKKSLIVVLLLFMTFIISACARDQDVLRVGMDLSYPPFETEEDGEPHGISVDIAHLLGEYLDREVEIINTDFLGLINSLNSGEIDIIIGSMSITEDRAQSVNFTDPYMYFKIISLINQDFADVHGIHEDTPHEDLLAIEDVQFVGVAAQVSTSIPENLGKDVIEATTLNSAITNVVQGTADILMMSAFPVTNGYRENPNSTMVAWDPFQSSPIGMAVAIGNDELLEQANAFVASMNEPGGANERLADIWDDYVKERLGRYGMEFFFEE